jgi:coniferyl-aldehyde dehydrogenase
MSVTTKRLAADPIVDARRLLEAQKRAHLREGSPSSAQRMDRLDRLVALLVEHGDELVDAMDVDFGARSKDQSRLTDIAAVISAVKHARKHLARWMRPERRSADSALALLGGRAEVRFAPKGVVGVLSPWNYPVNLALGPLASILAAGNRAIVKPSEHTPQTSAAMARLVDLYFDELEIGMVLGGSEVGEAFTHLPFDHLLFTGATSVGRHVMRAAAENLVPVTLELGGKSPVFVSRSADMSKAAARIMSGKLMNAGQTCLAPDYLIAERDVAARFVEAAQASVALMFPTLKDNPDYVSIINQRHWDRLTAHLEDARSKGAEIITINPANEDLSQQPARRLAPTLVLKVSDDMTLMQDEIFGPILPVKTVADVAEATAYVNAGPRPLGLYYFGEDRAEESAFVDGTISGGVTINDVMFHIAQEDLPFGGVGASGMGAYHGRDGFLEFSHRRAIYRQTASELIAFLRPPYGDRFRAQVSARLKR